VHIIVQNCSTQHSI